MLDASSEEEVPQWLLALLSEKFFNACIIHEDAKKNEKNIFCLDCCDGFCPHCSTNHRSHRLLQIRRYVYHDVIRIADADKLIDCAQVQTYTTNSAKVVFLNQRPQTRPPRSSGSICITCDRNLQESSLFCSISCKLQHILGTGSKLSTYIRDCEFLVLPDSFDDGQMTPNSVLEHSGSSSGGAAGLPECPYLYSTATTEIVKKKRSNPRPVCRPVHEITESIMNRRKGTPHRSPLH